MNEKKEYLLPFDNVDIIKQYTNPKMSGSNLIITIDYNNFSNIEITEKVKGFFKKKTTYIVTINENYLNNELAVIESNTILEFELKSTKEKFIEEINNHLKKDVLKIKTKTMKNKLIFNELLLFLESSENSIHRLPYNFDFNEKYIDFKIENFEKTEEIIESIRNSLPEFKFLNIDDYSSITENGFNLLRINFISEESFRIPLDKFINF